MFKITIDNFEFYLISKSIVSEDITYHKVQLSSRNLTTEEKKMFYAYISQSGGIWRLCSKFHQDSMIDKYDNYIQSTILDMRLQKFIFENYDKLPTYKKGEITCLFDKEKFQIEYVDNVNGRGKDINNIRYIDGEEDKVFNLFVQNRAESGNTTECTQADFVKHFYSTPKKAYESLVRYLSIQIKKNPSAFALYKKENNKYENVPTTFGKINPTISFYYNENWFSPDPNNEHQYYNIEIQYYLEHNFDIVDENNNPVDITKKPIPRIPIMKYNLEYKFGKFNNEYFEIRLKNKYDNSIIIVHVGKIILQPNGGMYKILSGYHICNIIDANVKITKYGLYDSYYGELDYYEDGPEQQNLDKKYITKALEYSDQIDRYHCMGTILFGKYNWICSCNEDKFLIRQLIEEDNKSNATDDYKKKYLKYKNKYLQLKKSIKQITHQQSHL